MPAREKSVHSLSLSLSTAPRHEKKDKKNKNKKQEHTFKKTTTTKTTTEGDATTQGFREQHGEKAARLSRRRIESEPGSTTSSSPLIERNTNRVTAAHTRHAATS